MLYISPLLQDCLLPVFAVLFTLPSPGSASGIPYVTLFLSFYVRSLRKWHTVSISIPRVPTKTEIYMNRVYIPLPSFHLTIPMVVSYNSINVPIHVPHATSYSPTSSFPITFRVLPFRKPSFVACLSPLATSQSPCLICFSLFSRFILPSQFK